MIIFFIPFFFFAIPVAGAVFFCRMECVANHVPAHEKCTRRHCSIPVVASIGASAFFCTAGNKAFCALGSCNARCGIVPMLPKSDRLCSFVSRGLFFRIFGRRGSRREKAESGVWIVFGQRQTQKIPLCCLSVT